MSANATARGWSAAWASAAPAAVEKVPSIPLAPRLAITRRSARGGSARSISRTDSEFPHHSNASAGSAATSSRATSGSDSSPSGQASSTAAAALAAAASALAPAGQPASGHCTVGRDRAVRCPGQPDRRGHVGRGPLRVGPHPRSGRDHDVPDRRASRVAGEPEQRRLRAGQPRPAGRDDHGRPVRRHELGRREQVLVADEGVRPAPRPGRRLGQHRPARLLGQFDQRGRVVVAVAAHHHAPLGPRQLQRFRDDGAGRRSASTARRPPARPASPASRRRRQDRPVTSGAARPAPGGRGAGCSGGPGRAGRRGRRPRAPRRGRPANASSRPCPGAARGRRTRRTSGPRNRTA